MGIRFEQGRHCNDGICAVGRCMGFSQNLGWEMGIGSPLQDPLCILCSVSLARTFHRIACRYTVMTVMHLSDNFFTARDPGGEKTCETATNMQKT